MMNHRRTVPLLLSALLAVAARAAEETSPRQFAFLFKAGETQTYAVDVSTKMNMDMRAGNEHQTQVMGMAMRYKIALTPDEGGTDAEVKLRLSTSGIEADWDMDGGDGHIVASLKNDQMTGTRNGVTIIDTANNIGVDAAKAIESDLMPLYLTGHVVLDGLGNIVRFEGDPPFVKHWTEACDGQIGL